MMPAEPQIKYNSLSLYEHGSKLMLPLGDRQKGYQALGAYSPQFVTMTGLDGQLLGLTALVPLSP